MGRELAHDALAMIQYRDNPAVCLIGDSEQALDRMGRTAAAAGCRIASATRIDADLEGISRCAPATTALVEIGAAADERALFGVLDWLRREAEDSGRRSVVSMPRALIDLVAARAWHNRVELLCDSDEAERTVTVAEISQRSDTRLHDINRDDGPLILQQLSEDVGRIAAILASLSEEEHAAIEGAKAGEDKDEPGIDAAYVRSIIRARRLRDQFFRGGLFADPAWDMLLDLFAARLEGTRVAVSSLCIAAAVPATTALRWIKALTDRGLFVRSADPQDGRRVYIALSDEVARSLTAYLRAVQRIAPAAI